MENACGALAVIACGWRLKMTTAEGKESEVQEGVCGGWYFVLANREGSQGAVGGTTVIWHISYPAKDRGRVTGFMG